VGHAPDLGESIHCTACCRCVALLQLDKLAASAKGVGRWDDAMLDVFSLLWDGHTTTTLTSIGSLQRRNKRELSEGPF